MRVQERIERKLQDALEVRHLEILNESHKHNVPPQSETHFKVVIVSNQFHNKKLRERHQMVYQVLAEEMAGPVHALSLQTQTPEQWEASGQVVTESPLCLGGSKMDHSPL